MCEENNLQYGAWTFLARCGATSISTGFIYNISLYNFKALTRPYVKWRDIFQGNYDVRVRKVHAHLHLKK